MTIAPEATLKQVPSEQEQLLNGHEKIHKAKIERDAAFDSFTKKEGTEAKEYTKRLERISEEMLKAKNPCEGFSTKDLPKDLQEYISSKCATTEAEPIMLSMSVLGMISGFIQRKCCIPEGEYFQTLYPNLWMLSIAKSGGFKTTALKKGCALAYKREKEIKEAEANVGVTAPVTTKENNTSVLLPNRATPEGLLEHLSQGYGGLITSSEFGEWLENLDRQQNGGLKALLTDLYDIPELYTYKTRTNGFLKVEKPFISICGVSTLEWVKKNLKPDDVSSGFFARFLIFSPPHKDDIPPALPKPRKGYDKEAEKRIYDTLINIGNTEYSLSPETKKLFEQFHDKIYKTVYGYSEKSKDILNPYLKRWSPYLLKLAMLLQIIEDPLGKEIGDSALNGAMSILEPAIKSTAHLFESDLGESTAQRKCRKVKEYIAKKGGVVSRRNLIKSKVLEGTYKEYDEILTTLIACEEIVEISESGKNYRLNLHNAE